MKKLKYILFVLCFATLFVCPTHAKSTSTFSSVKMSFSKKTKKFTITAKTTKKHTKIHFEIAEASSMLPGYDDYIMKTKNNAMSHTFSSKYKLAKNDKMYGRVILYNGSKKLGSKKIVYKCK